MQTRPGEEAKAEIENTLVTVLHEVQSIGKATGAAIGWGEFLRSHHRRCTKKVLF
jgi:hypothetical protein